MGQNEEDSGGINNHVVEEEAANDAHVETRDPQVAELAALVESMLRTIDHLQEEVGEMMLIGGARRRIPEGNDNGSVLIRGDEEDDSEDQKDESEPERESIDPEEDESGPPLAKRAKLFRAMEQNEENSGRFINNGEEVESAAQAEAIEDYDARIERLTTLANKLVNDAITMREEIMQLRAPVTAQQEIVERDNDGRDENVYETSQGEPIEDHNARVDRWAARADNAVNQIIELQVQVMEIRLLGETQEEMEETERENNELVFAGEDGGNQDEFKEPDYMNRDNEGEEPEYFQVFENSDILEDTGPYYADLPQDMGIAPFGEEHFENVFDNENDEHQNEDEDMVNFFGFAGKRARH